MTRLGDRLLALRRAKAWSREELHRKSGVSEQTILDIEKGLTQKPNTTTLGRLAKALEVDIRELAGDEIRFFARGSSVIDGAPRLHLDWNAPDKRSELIARVSPALSLDSPEITRFIDHLEILNDFAWLDTPSHIQTTTMEFSDIWSDPGFFIPYEASLLRFDRAGRRVDRLFQIDAGMIVAAPYVSLVKRVLLRHQALGLKPKVLRLDEGNSMHRRMGADCDVILILDAKSTIIVNYRGETDPAFIRSDNLAFASHASNVFCDYWKDCKDAQAFLDRFPATDREKRVAESEAEKVHIALDLSRSI